MLVAVVTSPVRRARARQGLAGSEGAVLLGVLVEFWLSDGDQPLPPSHSQSQDPLGMGMTQGTRLSSLDSWSSAAYGWGATSQ